MKNLKSYNLCLKSVIVTKQRILMKGIFLWIIWREKNTITN